MQRLVFQQLFGVRINASDARFVDLLCNDGLLSVYIDLFYTVIRLPVVELLLIFFVTCVRSCSLLLTCNAQRIIKTVSDINRSCTRLARSNSAPTNQNSIKFCVHKATSSFAASSKSTRKLLRRALSSQSRVRCLATWKMAC